jgi:hypothetical protein
MSMHFKLLIIGTVVFLFLLLVLNDGYEHESRAEGRIEIMSYNTMWTTRLTALHLCFVFVVFGHAVFANEGNSA